MKRAVLVSLVVSLTACNWDEAERAARCTRDPASCADGGADGGGEVDAGRSVFYRVSDAGTHEPVGVYPASNGRIWVVANVGNGSLVELRDAAGHLLLSRGFDEANVVSAYADGEVEPALAVLCDLDQGGPRELVVLREDGGAQGPVLREGTHVSMYRTGGVSMVSLWDANTMALTQEVFESATLVSPVGRFTSACVIDIVDLHVQRPTHGGGVALLYNAGSGDGTCDAGFGPGQFIVGDRVGGVQTVDPLGVRGGSNIKGAVAVGGSLAGGFRLLIRKDNFNLGVGDGVSSDAGLVFIDAGHVGATGGIIAGDVSDDFITFVSSGSIITGQTSGQLSNRNEVNVAGVAPWNQVTLGDTSISRVPVLRHGDSVWVLWAPREGGLQLTNLDPTTLGVR